MLKTRQMTVGPENEGRRSASEIINPAPGSVDPGRANDFSNPVREEVDYSGWPAILNYL